MVSQLPPFHVTTPTEETPEQRHMTYLQHVQPMWQSCNMTLSELIMNRPAGARKMREGKMGG